METLEGLLSDLIKLDYDAVEAYDSALKRLDNEDYKVMLGKFREDHLRHTKNLGAILEEMEKNVPQGPDAKQILTQGKVVLADLFGDAAILKAMKTNEDEMNTAYEKAVVQQMVTPEIRKVLQGNLEDEKRQREWIAGAIEEQTNLSSRTK